MIDATNPTEPQRPSRASAAAIRRHPEVWREASKSRVMSRASSRRRATETDSIAVRQA